MSKIPNNNVQTFILITTDKYSLHSLLRKLFFATAEANTKTTTNPKPLQKATTNHNGKMFSPVPKIHIQNTPTIRCKEGGRGGWKSQRLCLLAKSEAKLREAKYRFFPNLS